MSNLGRLSTIGPSVSMKAETKSLPTGMGSLMGLAYL